LSLIIGTNGSSSAEQFAFGWRHAASSSPVMALVFSLGLAALYAPAALAGLMYAVVGSTVTLVWAPSGIALAALVLLGPRVALGVTLGAFIANAWTDVTLTVAAIVAVGNTLGALLGSIWFTRWTSCSNALDRRSDVLAFIAIAATASTTVSAMVGASALWLGGFLSSSDWVGAFIKWWLGDMMGVLVVAPALMVWFGSTRPAITAPKALEALALGAMLVCASVLIFGESQIAGHGYYPAALGVFPFVIWGALRFGQRGSTLVTLGASALAVWGTTMGAGPFAVEHPVDSLVRWCAFAIVVAVTGLLLAASVTEQRRAQAELRRSHDDLEKRVNARTKELVDANIGLRREMSERHQLENELVRLSEVHQQAMGRELHDGLGQHLTSLALHCASLKQQLAERALPEVSTASRIVDLANEANAMTRQLARGLYPVALEFGGLVAALDRLVQQTRALGRMTCVFRCSEDAQVHDSMVAINLYRVAQEAVNNAVKYSQASCVKIELERIGEQHQMSISDDGIGIDFDRPSHSEGLGMYSMRYRARLLGGTLTVAPLALGGTRVTVVVSEVRSQQ
jgi:signal transduction histidine kinase